MKFKCCLAFCCFIFLILCTGTALSASVAPEEEWNWTYEGYEGGYHELAYAVQETRDGGYILAGESWVEYGDESARLTKFDSKGKVEWSKDFFNGSTHLYTENCLQQTIDGGYVLAGNIVTHDELDWYNSSSYPWLAKADSNGKEEWERTFGDGEGGNAEAIQKTDDGGYIIIGHIDLGDKYIPNYLIKTDSRGIEEWNKTLGYSSDSIYNIQKTEDGGFILAGARSYQDETGSSDTKFLLIKTDSDINEEWNKTFERIDIAPYYHRYIALSSTADGGCILAGTAVDANGNENAVLMKIDSDGNQEWKRTFGGGNKIQVLSVKSTSDGGYVLGGEIICDGVLSERGYFEPSAALLIKTDSNGNEEWNMTIESPTDNDENTQERVTSVQETSDKGYILAGETYYFDRSRTDAWLIKLSGEKNETDGKENETYENKTCEEKNEGTEVHELQRCINSLKITDNNTSSLNNRVEEISCHIVNGEEEKAVCKLEKLIELINEMSRRCELNSNQATILIEKAQKAIESIES
jgi:hypothetical protein